MVMRSGATLPCFSTLRILAGLTADTVLPKAGQHPSVEGMPRGLRQRGTLKEAFPTFLEVVRTFEGYRPYLGIISYSCPLGP